MGQTPFMETLHRETNSEAGTAELAKVLPDLLQNLRDFEKSVYTRFLTFVLIVTAIELAFGSKVQSLSVIGVSVTDLSVLQRLSPVVLSYLYFSMLMLLTTQAVTERAYDLGFGRCYPTLKRAQLERIVRPYNSVKMLGLMERLSGGLQRRLLAFATTAVALILLLGPPTYAAWTVSRCLERFGAADTLTWVAAIASLGLVGASILAFVAMGTLNSDGEAESAPPPPAGTVD